MKRARNIFGFGKSVSSRPRSRSTMTIADAARQAKKAGHSGRVQFGTWLESKHLDDRSPEQIRRLSQAYQYGMETREGERELREARAQEKRDAKTATRETKQAKKAEAERYAAKVSKVDENKIEEHFKRGGTIASFLAMNPGKSQAFERCVRAVAKRKGVRDAQAVCASSIRRGKKRNPIPAAAIGAVNDYLGSALTGAAVSKGASLGKKLVKKATRRNPADAAAAAYEDFHGRPSNETVTVTEQIHFHKHLPSAGVLRGLKVAAIDEKANVNIRFYSGSALNKQTFLAFNEKRNQLFVKGGDQSVKLRDFGIRSDHELETLGRVTGIDYFTTKDHLGDEGGTAIYRHKFRMTNQDGRHVTIRIARYPDLIYRTLEQRLEFSGGSYTILPEGIDR